MSVDGLGGLVNALVTLRNEHGEILLNGGCILRSLTNGQWICSRWNRFCPLQRSRFFELADEARINFHKTVVGFLKEEFKVKGIVSYRFKICSYVVEVCEGSQGRDQMLETFYIIPKSEFSVNRLISSRNNVAIVFLLRDVNTEKVHAHSITS